MTRSGSISMSVMGLLLWASVQSASAATPELEPKGSFTLAAPSTVELRWVGPRPTEIAITRSPEAGEDIAYSGPTPAGALPLVAGEYWIWAVDTESTVRVVSRSR